AARLTLDVALARPSLVPVDRVAAARAVLHRCGADGLARRLDACVDGPWQAVARHLTAAADRDAADERDDAARVLLDALGWPTVRIASSADDDARADDAISDRGECGAENETIVAASPDGALRLIGPSHAGNDPVLAVAAALLAREAVVAAAGDDADRRDASAEPAADDRGDADASQGSLERIVPGLIGRSAAMHRVIDRLTRLSRAHVPVLLIGESGTGKELLARHVHAGSARASRPFLAVNCAALSETLIQSELFGHIRGAFTGADRDRQGIFEAARGGTVFLDEIGDLPASVQGHLLRVLQEGEIRRLGESATRPVDVRIVAATHRDLAQQVQDGAFRVDLYYRLRVAQLDVPPLRSRDGDALAIADAFLARHPSGPLRPSPPRLTPAARRWLRQQSWPGNVRELRNALEVALALADDTIDVEHLDPPSLLDPPPDDASPSMPIGDPDVAALLDLDADLSYQGRLDALRRRLITDAFERANGNASAAARSLGLTRQAFTYQLKQLRLR
ncbi:MAG: sigma 54-interacting transcriptional regulator, partial [Acidobacteriota bacterium]